jgi:hypothetical protein
MPDRLAAMVAPSQLRGGRQRRFHLDETPIPSPQAESQRRTRSAGSSDDAEGGQAAREREDRMSDDVERSQPPGLLYVETSGERPQDGPSATSPQITVQVIGLEPQHVRVVERRSTAGEPAVFVELGGDDCKVTLAGRLYALQQVTAETAHRLAELEEVHREGAGQSAAGERRLTR